MTGFEDDLVTLRKPYVPGTHAYALSSVRSSFMSNRHVGNQLFVSGRARAVFQLRSCTYDDYYSPSLLVHFVELHDTHEY